MPTQPQQQQEKQAQEQVEQLQQEDMHQFQLRHHVVTDIQVETQAKQAPEPQEETSPQHQDVNKPPFSSQELHSKKARAAKNRPWLQKPASEEHKTPASEQDSTQVPTQATQTQPKSDREIASAKAVHQPQPERHTKATSQPHLQRKEQQKQTQQPQNLDQHQEQLQQQQQQILQQGKQYKLQQQQLEQQKQPQPTQPIISQAQPDSDTKAKSQTVNVLPQSQAESPDFCIKPLALDQAPPQAYTEAYAKAQALARNGFEEAKHCLQEHILEAISVFRDKRVSPEQKSVKERTLRTLDPELLEEFMRAAKGMEAFCTPSQLKDLEFFTQSVSAQWEACFSEGGSFAQAGQHLEALKELCATLSPEDAHRLAQTQLRECEKRLAAIQHQFSRDQDAPLPDSRIPVAFSEDVTTQQEPTKPNDKPQVSAEVPKETVKPVSGEKREVEKQSSAEEETTKKEALDRYENCKRTLKAQLAKNEQSIMDIPSDSVSLKGLHTRLQEIQFLRQETETLWSEYANQYSQCSHLSKITGLEQEKAELQEQWRSQQSNLQRRGSSLGTALRQIDSTENHMVDFTDRLGRYLRQPKDITGFTLTNTNILKDIKELDDNIQSELDQLSRLGSECSDLDPRDCFPLSREVETHRSSLDQLPQQVPKSE
uniref:basic-leucine zipper transcription factor A-like n=1 Tax=Monopterus albus TaxID=43700 RepID=UPI0009B47DBB